MQVSPTRSPPNSRIDKTVYALSCTGFVRVIKVWAETKAIQRPTADISPA